MEKGPFNTCGPNAHKFFDKNLHVVCACERERQEEREGERERRRERGAAERRKEQCDLLEILKDSIYHKVQAYLGTKRPVLR